MRSLKSYRSVLLAANSAGDAFRLLAENSSQPTPERPHETPLPRICVYICACRARGRVQLSDRGEVV